MRCGAPTHFRAILIDMADNIETLRSRRATITTELLNRTQAVQNRMTAEQKKENNERILVIAHEITDIDRRIELLTKKTV